MIRRLLLLGGLVFQVVLGGPFNPHALDGRGGGGGGPVFIAPNPQGWTTFRGGQAPQQHIVLPRYPAGARPVPTYQPTLPGYGDDDDE